MPRKFRFEHLLRSPPRPIAALGVLLGLFLVGMFLLSFRSGPRRPSIRLPDGSGVTLEACTYGTAHRLGSPILASLQMVRALTPFIPWRPTFTHGARDDSLVVWLSAVEKDGTASDFSWLGYIMLRDSHGHRFLPQGVRLNASIRPGGGTWNSGLDNVQRPVPPPTSGRIVLAADFDLFARREAVLFLEVYDMTRQKIGEFEIANPAAKKICPEWDPEPIPLTNRWENIEFVLRNLEAARMGIDNKMGFHFATVQYRPEFEIYSKGRRSENWELQGFSLRDATGNEWHSSSEPCWNEKTLRMEVTFSRKPEAEFSPEEVWEVGEIEIPAPGKTRHLAASQTVAGVTVRLDGLSGPGKATFVNGIPTESSALQAGQSGTSFSSSSSYRGGARSTWTATITSQKPALTLWHSPIPNGYKLSLGASTSEGSWKSVRSSSSAGEGHQLYILDQDDDAAIVQLKVLVHRTRTEEFIVPAPEPPEWQFETEQIKRYRDRIPKRPAEAGPALVDLTPFYTAGPERYLSLGGPVPNGHESRGFNFFWLPSGIQEFYSVPFDVRGVCQVAGLAMARGSTKLACPIQTGPIPVNQTAATLHFLHGALWPSRRGTLIGHYKVQYTDGQTLEIPLLYGVNIGESMEAKEGLRFPPEAKPLTFHNQNQDGNLYLLSWKNPRSDVAVRSVELISSMTGTAPFLAALSVNPP